MIKGVVMLAKSNNFSASDRIFNECISNALRSLPKEDDVFCVNDAVDKLTCFGFSSNETSTKKVANELVANYDLRLSESIFGKVLLINKVEERVKEIVVISLSNGKILTLSNESCAKLTRDLHNGKSNSCMSDVYMWLSVSNTKLKSKSIAESLALFLFNSRVSKEDMLEDIRISEIIDRIKDKGFRITRLELISLHEDGLIDKLTPNSNFYIQKRIIFKNGIVLDVYEI